MTMRSFYDQEHDRELAKHELRPGDKQPPSVLAIECAIAVRHPDLKLTAAAQLIEAFVDAERARIRLDAVAAGANA